MAGSTIWAHGRPLGEGFRFLHCFAALRPVEKTVSDEPHCSEVRFFAQEHTHAHAHKQTHTHTHTHMQGRHGPATPITRARNTYNPPITRMVRRSGKTLGLEKNCAFVGAAQFSAVENDRRL